MSTLRIDQQAARIRDLLDENQTLRERIEELEALWLKPVPQFLTFGLTKTEQLIFGALVHRDVVSKDQLMTLVYGLKSQPPDEKIIDVMVCKMRKKLTHLGIAINTNWGTGYSIPPESKMKVADLSKREINTIEEAQWTPTETDTRSPLPTSRA